MQAPAHILAGVIVNRIFKWRNYKPVALFLTFLICIFLHTFFDKLALSVYRPGDDFSNPLVLIYHIGMWLVSIVMLYVFWRDYKWGIVFSLIPEFDWLVISVQHLFHFEISFYSVPWIHFTLNYLLNFFPFSYMDLVPDNRDNPLGIFWELALIGILAFIYRAMIRYRKNIHF